MRLDGQNYTCVCVCVVTVMQAGARMRQQAVNRNRMVTAPILTPEGSVFREIGRRAVNRNRMVTANGQLLRMFVVAHRGLRWLAAVI